jgi:hypothetical protein
LLLTLRKLKRQQEAIQNSYFWAWMSPEYTWDPVISGFLEELVLGSSEASKTCRCSSSLYKMS